MLCDKMPLHKFEFLMSLGDLSGVLAAWFPIPKVLLSELRVKKGHPMKTRIKVWTYSSSYANPNRCRVSTNPDRLSDMSRGRGRRPWQ